MNGFLYYLPGKPIGEPGLDYARYEGGANRAPVAKGPDDDPGIVLTFAGDQMPAYHPDRQRWRKGPGGAYWVGVYTDAPAPGPEDLARPRVYAGEPVRLRDGKDWIVPLCRAWIPGRTPGLPRLLDLADDGKTWVAKVAPEFAALCDDAYQVWLDVMDSNAEMAGEAAGGPKSTLTGQDIPRVAVAALAANYRVGPVEIAMLGLWSESEMRDVLLAMIDWPEVQRRAEAVRLKNPTSPAAGQNTGSGERGMLPT